MLTNVTVKRRKSWLLAASALASSSLGVSEPALAQACGPLAVNVTCTSAGNNYPGGISYLQTTLATDLHVNLDSDVNVTFSGAQLGAVIVDNRGGKAELTANGAAITANVPGVNGLVATTDNGSGNAIITASGPIQVVGNGIVAIARGDLASVTYNGPGVTSSGSSATVIQAVNNGPGDAFIEARGNLRGDVVGSGIPNGITGLFASGGSNGTVHYTSGTIGVRGNFANGIYAAGDSATVNTDPGTTITVTSLTGERLKPGIALDAFGTAAAGSALTVNAASTIQMLGPAAPDPGLRNNGYGIRAMSFLDAPISVNYFGPGITTFGGNGMGIVALSGGGDINVTSSGPITTRGSGAVGIFADATNLVAKFPSEFRATPVFTGTPTGTVQVNATNVTTTGQFSTGIVANGALDVTVNIASGGSVNGGWQANLTGGSDLFGLPAAGVILNSTGGTATLTNDGRIGALSDRAVAGSLLFPSNNTSIINNGTITGFVQLVGGNNSILNNGTFDLRHFADTTGGGRDTLRVAIADLGTGPGNTFTNNGTLALLGAPGATTLDATGQYLPLGLTFNAMALGGPVHGQILGAATFTNSGTINLQANPVPGDVLLISGGHTPGSNGGGKFISGGSLLIDTVLNEGGTASQSDVLVLDNAVVGAGATGISVHIAGGPGALTPGNGILVVQGLGTTAPGAFSLASPVEAGAFSYLLFRGSVDASGPQNWYLRSTLTCSLTPTLPQCKPPVTGGGGEGGEGPMPPTPGPVIPDFRPAVPLYAALSPIATQYGFSSLGTLHERMGDPYAMVDPGGRAPTAPASPAVYLKAVPAAAPATDSPAIWGRLLGEVGKRDNDNFLSVGPDYTWNFGGLQSGFDLWHRESRDGARDHAGVYGTFGAIGADVQRVFRELGPSAGTISMNAVSFGGYWTHYGPTGWYVDAVTQGTWYDSDARSATGPALHTNGLGWAGSLEGGYPIALAGHLFLEPQAQLIYQRVRLNDGNDGDALVSFDNSDALQGRLGARLVKTWDVGAPTQPRPLDTWLRANLWHEFLNGTDTTFAGLTGANAITFAAPLKGTWAEIGGGATGAIGPNTTLFATTAYQHNIDGNHQFAWTGRAGVTMRW